MARWIPVGEGGAIDGNRVVAIGRAGSAPIKRLLASTSNHLVLNLTYGYPRNSVVVLDNGFVAVVTLTVDQLMQALNGGDDGQ